MMPKRLLAIGDIHGCYAMLLDLWKQLDFSPATDIAVFLGDYTDRGEDSAKVMEWVLSHQHSPNLYFLRGNHEVMLYDAFRNFDRSCRALWNHNGGQATTASMFHEGKFPQLLSPWLTAIQAMPYFLHLTVKGQDYFFAHAGIQTYLPLDQQDPEILTWSRELAQHPQRYIGNGILTFGHTPVQSLDSQMLHAPKPLTLANGHIHLLDTGSYLPQGRISCMDVLSGKVWQSYANPKEWR